jgi:hypothetical protein
MTYGQKLEALAEDARQTSNDLIAAALDTSDCSEARLSIAQVKYDRAEQAYHEFLEMMKAHGLSPERRFF